MERARKRARRRWAGVALIITLIGGAFVFSTVWTDQITHPFTFQIVSGHVYRAYLCLNLCVCVCMSA
jgi:hypothetical protein